MQFQSILDYQNLDTDLLKVESEIKGSKEFQSYYQTKNGLDAATTAMVKLNSDAGDAIVVYEKLRASVNEVEAKIKDIVEADIAALEDIGAADYYDRQVAQLLETLNRLERDAQRCQTRIEEIKNTASKTMDQGKLLQVKLRDAEKTFREYRAGFAEKISGINKEMAELEKKLPPKYLELYKSLRKNKVMPAFVEYKQQSKQCARCYMDIPAGIQEKLKNVGDWCECPNCRRILYIP
ncbi:MAG: hypothetical protein LBT55_00190 [Clostridiaceae bacterium]|jgi:predicted  nucleic acid-binding Zn-ribbon protein|nr:hypothetical protein [Clostridiaceae bacterium]